ncbi:MAG: hypothetical protein JWQ72_1694, partial [Polaromonas sp.]|nr:hypothetical protein [Polaromonas sp.]
RTILIGKDGMARTPSPQQETRTMTRIGTAQLGEAATYALAAAYFTSFVVAVEVALSKLIY